MVLTAVYVAICFGASEAGRETGLHTYFPMRFANIGKNGDVYDDLRMFNDVGCEPVSGVTARTTHGTGGAAQGNEQPMNTLYSLDGDHYYTLSPNPNDGNFTIHANGVNEEPVTAVVMNAVGECIYNKTLRFEGKDAQVQLRGAMPGIYMVRLTDAKNRKYTFKFVIR